MMTIGVVVNDLGRLQSERTLHMILLILDKIRLKGVPRRRKTDYRYNGGEPSRLDPIERYTLTVRSAYSVQVKRPAHLVPAAIRSSQRRRHSRRSRNRSRIAAVQCSTSPTAPKAATGPPISRNTRISLNTTGVPQAGASSIGSPKPSDSEGSTAKAARPIHRCQHLGAQKRQDVYAIAGQTELIHQIMCGV